MVDKTFFERPNMAVALDLGLRVLRFSKEGKLYVPDKTKEILITRTVAYGTEGGYEPEKTAKGEIKKAHRGSFNEPGTIYMYFTPWGYVLAISTDEADKYSHVSVHGGLPLSGFDEELVGRDLGAILDGPNKITKKLGIDKEVAEMLDGQTIYDNKMIEIRDNEVPKDYRFDASKPKSDAALGTFSFKQKK